MSRFTDRYNITHDEIQNIINRRNNGINDTGTRNIQIFDNTTNMLFDISREELQYIRRERANMHFSNTQQQLPNNEIRRVSRINRSNLAEPLDQEESVSERPRQFLNIQNLPPPNQESASERPRQFLNLSNLPPPARLRRSQRLNSEELNILRSNYEEDSTDNDTFSSDNDSLSSNENISNCMNDNLITLESYKQEDDPIMIYVLNSNNKFEKAICITQEEYNDYIESDLKEDIPTNIMTLATTPLDFSVSGIGSHPTKNVVIKLPINQLYITLGSAIRINKEFTNNKIWYALPMYNNKRRRITNIQGLVGSSMNHGQIPGFKIYKLLRRDQIQQNIKIKETDDYPRYTDNQLLNKHDVEKIINILLQK